MHETRPSSTVPNPMRNPRPRAITLLLGPQSNMLSNTLQQGVHVQKNSQTILSPLS